LHYACYKKPSLEMVQVLVERNPAALEAANNAGNLPLHYACLYKAPLEAVQFLVERNPATAGMVDTSGAFPFDIACHQEASLEVLRVLVERTPATVKMTGGGEELLLPLHFTCSHRAGLYSLQYLLGIDPSAVETTNNDGNIQQPGIIEGVAGFNRNGPSLC
jgi:ankyrin repeat protein